MAITYPLTPPTTPGFVSSNFGIKRSIAISESPFTGQQKSYEYDRALWYATLSLPPMKRTQAAAWCAFLVALKGRRGTFLLGDPDAKEARGNIPGDRTLSSAASAGDNEISFAYTASDGYVAFEAGDYFQIGTTSSSRLYMVVEQATVSSNSVTATFEPALRADASSGTSIIVSEPKSVFRLDSNEVSWDADNISKYGITFSCTEAL